MQIKLGDFLREICIKTVVNNEYPVLTSSKNGIYLQSEYFNKQVASKDNTGYKIIKKGQFTYRAMSDTGEFYPNMLKCVDVGIVSPAYPVFEITNRDIIYPQYLQYFFRSNTFRYNISGLEQGSTRTNIKFNKMKNIKIKLPPLLEQKKVIMILDRVGSLISKRQEQLKYFDELTKSLFIEMFGDLKSNSKKWIKKTFTDIASIDTNMINVFDNYENYPHIGIESIEKETGEIIGYRTVKEDKVVSGKYLFTEQHIIYSKIRPNLNKVALPKCKGVCSADAYPILVKIDECHRVFLAYTMRSKIFLDYIIKLSNRTNLPKVNKKQVEGFICPVPPLDLQNRFADYVSSIDKSKLAVKKSLEELEILKKSLMQKYFA